MNNQELKKQIRWRLHAQNKELFAENFVTCPNCKGAQKVCTSKFGDATWIEELGSCSECSGEGFIDKSSE